MSQITIGKIIRRTKKKLRKGYKRYRRNYRLRYTVTIIVGIGLVVFLGMEYSMNNRKEGKEPTNDSYHKDNTTLVRPTDVYGNEIPEHVDITDKEELEEYIYPESSITSLPIEVEVDPENFHVLVNKDYSVDKYYVPDDLIEPDVPFNFDEEDEKRLLKREAAHALERMFAAADEEGHYLEAVSGYRSYGRQQLLFRNNLRRNGLEYTSLYSAMPGRSEHQTGWAMDITANSVDNKLSTKFGETVEGKWVAENCYKFGFIIRYPKGKEDITGYAYEPWHLRYVGYNLARFLYDNDITLDQYYGYVLNKAQIHERELAYYKDYMKQFEVHGTPEPLPTGDIIEDEPEITDEPIGSDEPLGSNEPVGTKKPVESKEPDKTQTPQSSEPPKTSEPTKKPTKEPTKEPEPTKEVQTTPSEEPTPPTDTVAPTKEPTPTVEPVPTKEPEQTVEPTDEPVPTKEPEQTIEPTAAPVPTKEPEPTTEPVVETVPTKEPDSLNPEEPVTPPDGEESGEGGQLPSHSVQE